MRRLQLRSSHCWTELLFVIVLSSSWFIHFVSAAATTDAAAENSQLPMTPLRRGTSLLRRLQDGNDYDYNNPDKSYIYYPYDLSTFSIRYDKCQNIRYYSDDMAADEDADTPLAVKQLVAFRICPSDECATCSESENYGKYIVDLETYLQSTVENQRETFEQMCENCDEQCNDYGEYCNGCGKLCYQYENLEAAGLVDASEYIECQQLEINDNDDDDGNNNNNGRRRRTRRKRRRRRLQRKLEEDEDGEGDEEGEQQEDNEEQNNENEDQQEGDEEEEEEPVYYIGPKCAESGEMIQVGLFYDEYCTQPFSEDEEEAMNLSELLGGELSYHLMSHSFSDDGSVCLSCQEPEDKNEQDENDRQDADDVNEMCEELYNAAAKCETPTGITSGFIQTNREEGNYENQVETEFMACTFIDSIYWNSYQATGEINYMDPPDVYERHVTKRQGIVLGALFFFMGCCFVATWYLEKRIKQVTPSNKLTGGGAMGGTFT